MVAEGALIPRGFSVPLITSVAKVKGGLDWLVWLLFNRIEPEVQFVQSVVKSAAPRQLSSAVLPRLDRLQRGQWSGGEDGSEGLPPASRRVCLPFRESRRGGPAASAAL